MEKPKQIFLANSILSAGNSHSEPNRQSDSHWRAPLTTASNSKSSKIESHPFQGLYVLITTPNHPDLQIRPVELHIKL